MLYYSDIKKDLYTVELDGRDISYKLSYNDAKDLKNYDKQGILNYINDNYINDKKFEKKNIINDLVTLKTYRDNIEIYFKNRELFTGFLTALATVSAILISFLIAASENVRGEALTFVFDNIDWVLKIALFTILIYFVVLAVNFCGNSKSNKLKVVNKAINILEAINEDMDKDPDTWKFNLEVANSEESIATNSYSVKVTEK